jgi:putative addiction module component (TIGR02574 family)
MSTNIPTAEIEAVAEQAMRLSPEDRAELGERLLFSVAATQPTLHPSWAPELARRVAELDSGEVVLIPAEEVFAEARSIIDNHRTAS